MHALFISAVALCTVIGVHSQADFGMYHCHPPGLTSLKPVASALHMLIYLLLSYATANQDWYQYECGTAENSRCADRYSTCIRKEAALVCKVDSAFV